MAFYIFQARLTFLLKAGYADGPEKIASRGESHGCAGGPQDKIGTIPDAPRAIETEVLERLRPFRARDVREPRRRFFEVCPATPDVLDIIHGDWLRRKGFQLERRARDPRRETTRDWLERASHIGDGRISEAARHALDENARLRRVVPRSARGGWDLNEMIGGMGFVDRQMSLPGFRTSLIEGKDYLIHRCTYRGAVFDFPVFAEWYERQHGRAAPGNAVYTGLSVPRAKLESGRRGRPVRRRDVDVADGRQVLMDLLNTRSP